MPVNLTNAKSILVHIADYRFESALGSGCMPSDNKPLFEQLWSETPYGVTRPQWVNDHMGNILQTSRFAMSQVNWVIGPVSNRWYYPHYYTRLTRASWGLKSLDTRLFIQQLIEVNIKETLNTLELNLTFRSSIKFKRFVDFLWKSNWLLIEYQVEIYRCHRSSHRSNINVVCRLLVCLFECLSVCPSVSNITGNRLNGFSWNFQDRSNIICGTFWGCSV